MHICPCPRILTAYFGGHFGPYPSCWGGGRFFLFQAVFPTVLGHLGQYVPQTSPTCALAKKNSLQRIIANVFFCALVWKFFEAVLLPPILFPPGGAQNDSKIVESGRMAKNGRQKPEMARKLPKMLETAYHGQPNGYSTYFSAPLGGYFMSPPPPCSFFKK